MRTACQAPRNLAGLRAHESAIHVPGNGIGTRPIDLAIRERNHCPLLAVELVAVAKVTPKTRTHPEPVPLVDSQISTIKEDVYVRSQKETIVHAMLAVFSNRPNVRCLKHRLHSIPRYSAPAVIRRQDK